MKIAKLALPLVVLWMMFAASCENDTPNTLIRLIIDSDLVVGTELSKLEVRIFDRDGKDELRRQDFALGQKREGTRYALPFSIKLAPEARRSSSDFRLVVTGIGPVGPGGSDVEVVEQQALVSFRPGEALRLDIFLARTCLLKLCRDDEGALSSLTCDIETGACGEVPTREDLPTVSGDGVRQYEEEKGDAGTDADEVDADRPDELEPDQGESGLAQEMDAYAPDGGAATSDASSDSATTGSPATAAIGSSCGDEGARACGAYNSSDALLCSGGKWTLRVVCDGDTRCDSREGGTRGTCQPVVQACTGKRPNDGICEGAQIRTCGVDLVESTTRACAVNQHCVSAPTAHCECDTGYLLAPGDTCTNIDECVVNGCQHASRCNDGIAKYSCDCAGTGYQGEFCQDDIDECAQSSSCSSAYPCAQTQAPGYTCLGHMADWPMPDSTAGAKFAPSYDTNVAGVVKDLITGLWWERNNFMDLYSWANARAYCDQLILDSRTDWRLPTKIELESIIDFSRSPAINAAFVSPGADNVYWTSSTNIEYPDAVWEVTFADGRSARGSKNGDTNRVRCVRSDRLSPGVPSGRYQINESEGSVLDKRTQLTWQRATDRQARSLSAAHAFCQSRGTGWRVPTAKELLTLADPTTSPSIDVQVFADTPTDWFQSATLAANDATQNWSVLFSYPYTGKWQVDDGALVRCVK